MSKIRRRIVVNGVQKWIRADSEQEYAEKVVELFTEKAPNFDKHLFAEYAEQWFELYSKPNIEQTTAKLYSDYLQNHIIPFFGDMCIEDITPNDVQRFVNQIPRNKAHKRVAKMVSGMIFDCAIEDGYISENPSKNKKVKVTGAASVPRKPYSVEQMRYIIANLGKIKDPFERAFMAVQALHPLRPEETYGLQWQDIDIPNRLLYVRRAVTHVKSTPVLKGLKTEHSARVLSLSKLAVPYLHPGNPTDFIVSGPEPIDYVQVAKMCRHIVRDIDFDEKITPSRFRPTVLTDIYDQTRDIKATQTAAGHSNPSITLQHYVNGRNSPSDVTKAIDMAYCQFSDNEMPSTAEEC